MLIIESDCTFIFAVLLSLAVGFEVFETRHNRRAHRRRN